MARARNIKPGFFKNEDLAELSFEARLLFIGLWTLADREGRMEDRPKRIKGELFPFDSFDVDSMLNQLQESNFVVRYEVSGKRFLEVVNFVKHQDPHYKERASEIPAPAGRQNLIVASGITKETRARIMERDEYRCRHCGAEDYLSIDHIVPTSRGGSSEDSNLQVLCLKCNRAKGNKLEGEQKGTRRSKHDDTSLKTRPNVDSTLNQDQPKDGGSNPEQAPLIPDSLIPDSLIPEETTSSGKPDPEPSESSDLVQAKEVLEYLNAKTRSAFRAVPANLDLIRARLKEGYSLQALKSVVNAKTLEWIDDAKMQKFLRPATLFGRTNFSQYAGVVEGTPARDWWLSAGFSNRYEAESAGCTERNAARWSNGHRVEVAA